MLLPDEPPEDPPERRRLPIADSRLAIAPLPIEPPDEPPPTDPPDEPPASAVFATPIMAAIATL